ncbi:hypothetical protein GCM10009844_30070 [Nocardioides koreensis]|uniref:TetR/AcrR family transcriptional regulator n=1 Tax=Nocardioides koreensis TaxID=433651 RepID=A0ABN2ZXY6_9ACTN
MDRLDSVLHAMFRLVVTNGLPGPSLRSVAREAGISASGIVNHFEGAERMWTLAAHRWAADRASSQIYVTEPTKVIALLAQNADGVHDQAFDLALTVIGLGHPGVAAAMADFRRSERERLARVVPELGRRDLDLLVAVIEGLRFAMSLGEGALSVERARAALEQFVGELLTSAS